MEKKIPEEILKDRFLEDLKKKNYERTELYDENGLIKGYIRLADLQRNMRPPITINLTNLVGKIEVTTLEADADKIKQQLVQLLLNAVDTVNYEESKA